MKTLKQIKEILQNNKEGLEKEYYIEKIGIFGSYAREEQKECSDVDILVEIGKPIGFIKFIRLENSISHLLELKVDLATKNALKPYMREQILNEVQYV